MYCLLVLATLFLAAALMALAATTVDKPDSALDGVVPGLITGLYSPPTFTLEAVETYAVRVHDPTGSKLEPG